MGSSSLVLNRDNSEAEGQTTVKDGVTPMYGASLPAMMTMAFWEYEITIYGISFCLRKGKGQERRHIQSNRHRNEKSD